MAKTKKSPKPKKEDLIRILAAELTDTAWEIISQLRGLPDPGTRAKRENLLNSLFKKSITRGRAKDKSRELQQWLEARIGELLGEPHGKDTEICSRAGSQSGPDVGMSPRICALFPLTAECKSGDSWSIPAAIRQCQANLYPNTDWVLVLDRPSPVKEKRIPAIICIDGEVFFRILREGLCQK
jgi:hypothetical protein